MTPSDQTELRGLLDALCEDCITPEQVRRLEEMVLADPQAEAYYVQYMALFAELSRRFRGTEAAQARRAATAVPRRQVWRRRIVLWGAIGVAGLAAAVLLVVMLDQSKTARLQVQDQEERGDDTVALLLQAPGAVWERTDPPPRVGAPLAPGMLRLKSGHALLQFYCGATVLLQGPAELQLVSRTRAYCARGKLRATVPAQAQGFTIASPKLDIVDRGTEFGLDVGAGEQTEVHVFQGKVELYGAGQKTDKPRSLTTGQGLRLEEAGATRSIPLNPAAFPTAKELADRTLSATRLRHEAWVKASKEWRADPDLLIWYLFDQVEDWDRTLVDQGFHQKDPHNGAIVGCSWTQGRWPDKRALEFKQVSDRVRLQLPGKFVSISMLAWVRVDGLPNVNNSLMMADGWSPGGMHWQIGSDGMLILGVQSNPKGKGAHYHAPGAITPEMFGDWIQLAVVYDGEQGQVSHYVNGRAVAQLHVDFDIPLVVGSAELGNWNLASHRNNSPIRFFTGCMDEFMLFGRALSSQEIERIYEQSRPAP
jgi:hypothetical protein